MELLEPTRLFLRFLQHNPLIRSQIRAAPGKTLLYAGKVISDAWKEVEQLKVSYPEYRDKQTLSEVLARIALVGQPYPTLLSWGLSLDRIGVYKYNGFIAWRALSGIFAANAVGAVSFYVGSGVSKKDLKVFAATEISVLARNPRIDQTTRDALGYYERCLRTGNPDMNFGFIHG